MRSVISTLLISISFRLFYVYVSMAFVQHTATFAGINYPTIVGTIFS